MLVFSDTKDHTYARELPIHGYHGVYGVVYYRGSHPPVFHAQQCLSDHLFWGTHFSSAAPLKSAVASAVPIPTLTRAAFLALTADRKSC